MSFLKKLSLIVLTLVLYSLSFALYPGSLQATGSTGPDSLKIEMGSRAVAMGSAYTAIGDEPHAAAWNPASLSRIEARQFGFTHALSLSDAFNDFGTAVIPFPGPFTFGFSFLYSTMVPITVYNDQGQAVDTAQVSDTVTTVSLAEHLAEGLAVGVNLKYFTSTLYFYNASGTAADFGVLYRFPLQDNRLYLGASVTNLGPGVTYISVSSPLPTKARIGLGYGFWLSNMDRHIFAADLEWPKSQDERKLLNMGYEWWMGHVFFLRTGYRLNALLGNLTLGFGFMAGKWRLDYAFVPFSGIGDTHRVSLMFEWK